MRIDMMVELRSDAERRAEEANQLHDFAGFALRGAKQQVAELLETLGRVGGMFSTYTDHSIRHVDHMLAMLDWVIPASTKEKMTPVDWLMITLGIYYHDLGMIISKREFDNRRTNRDFNEFRDKVLLDPKYGDFRSRAGIATDAPSDTDEAFLYQEFIRIHHAERIKQWVTGRMNVDRANGVENIVKTIKETLKPLPTRFREHLAIVCESHHLNDLHNIDQYPLYQQYGTGGQACSANVQYSSVLLRTVDLLHVTKDRAPSVAFSVIGITDPIGIREWQRQQGTFAVHPRHRQIDMEDPDTHVIVVEADFDNERGFFPLSEYIAWANTELDQSRRWITKSQATTDARDYAFPWRKIEGHILVDGRRPEPLQFVLDRDRLLNLLVGHTLYNDPTVAVRELVQNAIDAVRFQRHLDRRSGRPHEQGRVLVSWSESDRELIVEDNGTGMDQDVIESHLMRVGASFYDSDAFKSLQPDFTPISRFGIGILTCFMISDDIEIVTLREGNAFRLRMTSAHADYLLNPLGSSSALLKSLRPHGTRVRLRVRKTVDLKKRNISAILRHWIILPECPVFYQSDGIEESIGFENAEAALQSGLPRQTHFEQHVPRAFRECDNEGRSYELVIGVREGGFVPEKSFISADRADALSESLAQATQRTPPLPLVCVEGIRVDSRVPGVGRGIACLLSVKGNRAFRTTVARDGLEQDEEYDSVAMKSLYLIFKHIESEVDRISRLPGTPYSQASSAARWLTRALTDSTRTGISGGRQGAALRHFEELVASLPSIVVEDKSKDSGAAVGMRKLISKKEMLDMEYFCTIDSSAFDYLGVVSRDLGTEIEIHRFIESIGVDLKGMPAIPLVVDAAMHASWILGRFEPDIVSMGLARQYTKVRWKRGGGIVRISERGAPLYMDEGARHFLREAVGEDIDLRYPRLLNLQDVLIQLFGDPDSCRAAEFDSDIGSLTAVRMSWLTVINSGKKAGEAWSRLCGALAKAQQTEKQEAVTLLYCGLVCVFAYCFRGKDERRHTAGPMLAAWWERNRETISQAVVELGYEGTALSSLEELRPEHDEIVDTKAYWRDWQGTG